MFEAALLEGSPGVGSAVAAAQADVATLDRAGALLLVGACERLIRMYQAIQAQAIVVAAGPKPASDDVSGNEPLDEAAEEVAVVLGGQRDFQLHRVDTARFLSAWLPETSAAMRDGRFGWYEATLMVRTAEQLTRPDKIARLEQMIVPRGANNLARRLRRALARLDPEALRRKAEDRRTQRSLTFWKDKFGSGDAEFGGHGPSELLAQLSAAIDLQAKERQPGDCRTIATRRFDVLLDWARERLGLPPQEEGGQGSEGGPGSEHADPTTDQAGDAAEPAAPPRRRSRCGSCGRSGPPRIPINVTVSLDTLLGLSQDPGELDGWGLLDPDTARELAADGEWRRWLIEPGTGRLLDVGAGTYRPNAALDRFVRARDRTCRFPNCTRPAVRCDLDHTLAYRTGGATTACNLTPLCRRHHRLKHEADWNYERTPDDATDWQAPSGRHYPRPPERHTDDDWLEPPWLDPPLR